MQPVVFSDLDDTIFQTARKMSVTRQQGATQATHALNGSHSYMSTTQQHLLDWLLQTTRFIPVTARSVDALQRCKIPFTDYRICTNGAIMLKPDNSLDMQWFEAMKVHATAASKRLQELLAYVNSDTAAGSFRCWIVQEYDVGFYFCVKSNAEAVQLDEIDQALTDIAGTELVRHRNDNNLSFTPVEISKRNAVDYLKTQLINDTGVPVLGMGDSLTDLPFMAACDMLVIPQNSQIDNHRLQLEQVND